jgi:hypothetical protein
MKYSQYPLKHTSVCLSLIEDQNQNLSSAQKDYSFGISALDIYRSTHTMANYLPPDIDFTPSSKTTIIPNHKASISSSPCPQYNQSSDRSLIPCESSTSTHTTLSQGKSGKDSSSISSSSSHPPLTSQNSILSPHDNPPIDFEHLQEDDNPASLSNKEQPDDEAQSLRSQPIRLGRTQIPNRKISWDEWVNSSTTIISTQASRTMLGYIFPLPSLQDYFLNSMDWEQTFSHEYLWTSGQK